MMRPGTRMGRPTPSIQVDQLDSEMRMVPCAVPEGRKAKSSPREAALKIVRYGIRVRIAHSFAVQ
jgi:hypothetical protein